MNPFYRLALFSIIVVLFSFSSYAMADLTVTDITFDETPHVGDLVNFTVHIKNVGDETYVGRDIVYMNSTSTRGEFDNSVGIGGVHFVQYEQYSHSQGPVLSVILLDEEEIEYEQTPVRREGAHPSLETVEIPSGHTLLLRSPDSQVFPLRYYDLATVGIQERLMSADLGIHSLPDENTLNNHFVKTILVKGSVVEGPAPSTGNQPSLEENEYYRIGQGCAEIRGDNICVGQLAEEDATGIYLSVNEESVEFSPSSPLVRIWMRVFGDGRIGPRVVMDNVELSVYPSGFKARFLE